MNTIKTAISGHKVVSREEWLDARKKLLKKERIHPAARPAERRTAELPWVKVEKRYVFDAPQGKVTLADLFDGRSQLVIYHSCSTGLEGLPELLVRVRPYRRRASAPRSPRRNDSDGLAGTAGQDRGVQETYGLAVQVGVVIRQRLQP